MVTTSNGVCIAALYNMLGFNHNKTRKKPVTNIEYALYIVLAEHACDICGKLCNRTTHKCTVYNLRRIYGTVYDLLKGFAVGNI